MTSITSKDNHPAKTPASMSTDDMPPTITDDKQSAMSSDKSFQFGTLPNELQRDILKYHVHGNRVIALQGFIRSSELLSSRNAPRTYEDFERERDRRSMAGLPARLESTTKVLTTNHRSARFLAFRSASDYNRTFLGISKHTQELVKAITKQPNLREMVLHNPNGIYYISNFNQFLAECNIDNQIVRHYSDEPVTNTRGTSSIQDGGVTHIAFDVKLLWVNIACLDANRIADFFAYFPQFESVSLVLGDSPEMVDVSDTFVKALHGYKEAYDTWHQEGSIFEEFMTQYSVGGRGAGHLAEKLWEIREYRESVRDGTRKKLEIKMVRWKQ